MGPGKKSQRRKAKKLGGRFVYIHSTHLSASKVREGEGPNQARGKMIAMSHHQTGKSRELTWEGFLEDTVHRVWTVDDVKPRRHNFTSNDGHHHPA
jgi:hypothetical protein